MSPEWAMKSFSGVGGAEYEPPLLAKAEPNRPPVGCCRVMRLTTTSACPATMPAEASPTAPAAPPPPPVRPAVKRRLGDTESLGGQRGVEAPAPRVEGEPVDVAHREAGVSHRSQDGLVGQLLLGLRFRLAVPVELGGTDADDGRPVLDSAVKNGAVRHCGRSLLGSPRRRRRRPGRRSRSGSRSSGARRRTRRDGASCTRRCGRGSAR